MGQSEVSLLLQQAQDGSDVARESLFTLLHDQLRAQANGLMRNERVDHTLQATALVNEACLKLMSEGVVDSSANRRQLFHAAIRAMRQVLIDHARARGTRKRGGDLSRQTLDIVLDNFESTHQFPFSDLDAALERLRNESPNEHEVLSLRFFAGLTIKETSRLLDCSESTVEASWRFARAKLLMSLS